MLPMRDGRTNDKRRTREDRATHPMEAGWLSFAIVGYTEWFRHIDSLQALHEVDAGEAWG